MIKMESRLVDPGWWLPGSGLWPPLEVRVHSRQPSTAFSTPGDGKRPFCTLKFLFFFASSLSASTNFKAPPSSFFSLFRTKVRPPVKPVNNASQQVVEGWISTSDSARHSPAPLSKLVRTQGAPQGKAYCPQFDPTPLWFCLFKWDS